jgi:DNA-binding PadR family transcriptional regulator
VKYGGDLVSRSNSFLEEQLTDSAYYILLALLKPMHGYGIMQFIEELTSGEVLIGPATLYTILKKMQEVGFIMLDEDNDRRKTYAITCKGREVITREIDRREKMAEHGKAALNRLERGE